MRVKKFLFWQLCILMTAAAANSALADSSVQVGGSAFLPLRIYTYLKATRGSPLAPSTPAFAGLGIGSAPTVEIMSHDSAMPRDISFDRSLTVQLALAF